MTEGMIILIYIGLIGVVLCIAAGLCFLVGLLLMVFHATSKFVADCLVYLWRRYQDAQTP